MIRVIVHFHEQGIHPAGDCRTHQIRDVFPLPSRYTSHGRRQLDRVRCVVAHGVARLRHDGKTPHVVDQHVVTEKGPPLRQEDLLVAVGFDLTDRILHVPGAHELTLFEVNRTPCLCRGPQDRRLAAKIGRDLHHVAHLPGCRAPGGI